MGSEVVIVLMLVVPHSSQRARVQYEVGRKRPVGRQALGRRARDRRTRVWVSADVAPQHVGVRYAAQYVPTYTCTRTRVLVHKYLLKSEKRISGVWVIRLSILYITLHDLT